MTSLLTHLEIFIHKFFKSNILISMNGETSKIDTAAELPSFDIVVYLPTPPSSYYQLHQWLNPLVELNKQYSTAVITRDISTFVKISKHTPLPIVQTRRYHDLRVFYQSVAPKIVLYVNNSLKNNYSLLYKNGYHIHLNHGESEKESMSSNQSKAYDYVFTVGQRGYDRYKENLLNFNEKKYLKIGRPQLDFIKPVLNNSNKFRILYAPTWEGNYDKMDYCSIEKYGINIVNEVIKNPDYILIYKPHPLVGSYRKSINKAHNKILDIIKNESNAFHYDDKNIIDIFSDIDFAFFDNSSVMIDFLYFEKPGAYIQIREDIKSDNFHQAYSFYNERLRGNNIASFVEKSIKHFKKSKHSEIKEYYLGNYKKGESTDKFISTISSLVDKRNIEIKFKSKIT